MTALGTFYVGRVVKTGISYGQEKLIEGLLKASPLKKMKFKWAFVDVAMSQVNNRKFISGQLAQYFDIGEIETVEESTRSKKKSIAKNQIRSSARFIYFPEHSGIIYLNVWGKIPSELFRTRFCEIIDNHFEKMFIKTEIEPITDYKKFSTKIKELDEIKEISATVHLPNPLFGELWEDLDDELRSRNSEKLAIVEKAKPGLGIKTSLVNFVESILDKTIEKKEKPTMSEAAVLMAADGYGKGKVIGLKKGVVAIIKTHLMELTFTANKEIEERELAKLGLEELDRVVRERNMKHGK